jgi:hypothetical protein
MKRIGITASKIAQGNVVAYNFYVVLISCLFSAFLFVVAGLAVVFALVIITYFGDEIAGFDTAKIWSHVLMVCMISLTIVVSAFNIMAIIRNIRLGKRGGL